MKKLSYPAIDGHDQTDLMPPGESSNWYDTFSPTGGRTESAGVSGGESEDDNPSIPANYSEGMMFRLNEDDPDEDLQEISDAVADLLGLLEGGSVLSVGSDNDRYEAISKEGYSITSISQKSSSYISDRPFHQKVGDIRFHNFKTKFDGFIFSKKFDTKDNYKIALLNVFDHLRPHSFGLIHNCAGYDGVIRECGFKIINKYANNIIVEKNDLDKISVVNIYSEDNSKISFLCDVAESVDDKRVGLQAYQSLDDNSGLLFKYSRPTDVAFYMGTVGYPIDIIFVDADDKVKKIVKNVSPGSLGLHNCAQVKNVLEIGGGLSSKLGISIGDSVFASGIMDMEEDKFSKAIKVAENYGVKKLFVKTASSCSNTVDSLGDNKLLFLKNANIKNNFDVYSGITSIDGAAKDNVYLFDIDDCILSDSSYIRVFSARETSADDVSIYRDLNNNSFSVNYNDDSPVYYDVPASYASRRSFWDSTGAGCKTAIGPGKSFDKFAHKNSFDMINRIADRINDGDNVVVATKNIDLDRKILSFMLHSKIASVRPECKHLSKISVVYMPKDFDMYDVILSAQEKYVMSNVVYHANMIRKTAGMPVADSVKNKARHAEKYFDRSDKLCDKILIDIKKNHSEYEKIQGGEGSIKNSKGQYNESVKRISRKVKKMLLSIKDGIKIMNEIKDISTTSEIIDSLALSSKGFSESVKDVFDLIEKIELEEFMQLLSDKTGNGEKTGEDLKLSISRMKQYINSNILGILILSE